MICEQKDPLGLRPAYLLKHFGNILVEPNKTSNNTSNTFQVQFDDNQGFFELDRFFMYQLLLKTLVGSLNP